MKNIFAAGIVFSGLIYALWTIGLLGNAGVTDLDGKLYSIRTQEALIVLLLSYIAWRVTPDSKPQ